MIPSPQARDQTKPNQTGVTLRYNSSNRSIGLYTRTAHGARDEEAGDRGSAGTGKRGTSGMRGCACVKTRNEIQTGARRGGRDRAAVGKQADGRAGGTSDPWLSGCPRWARDPARGDVECSESCPGLRSGSGSGSGLGSESESRSGTGTGRRFGMTCVRAKEGCAGSRDRGSGIGDDDEPNEFKVPTVWAE